MKKNKIILQDIKDILNKNFPGEIDKIILFGSQASGNSKEYSDYDILIIMNSDYEWKKEHEIYDILYEIDLKYDILLDIKLISKNELNTVRGGVPFIQDALVYGVVI